MTTTIARPTFADLAARDPRLLDLERAILVLTNDPLFDADDADLLWSGRHGLKARMAAIVGTHGDSADPALLTAAAYDAAYRHLRGLLEGEER